MTTSCDFMLLCNFAICVLSHIAICNNMNNITNNQVYTRIYRELRYTISEFLLKKFCEYFLCGTVELSRRSVARDLPFVKLCWYG
jgi:hypothetical protein